MRNVVIFPLLRKLLADSSPTLSTLSTHPPGPGAGEADEPPGERMARHVRCRAFNAASALVATTQSQLKFYAMPMELVGAAAAAGGVGDVWSRLLQQGRALPLFAEYTTCKS